MRRNHDCDDTSTGTQRAVIRKAAQAERAQSRQPAMLELKPLFMLLFMLRELDRHPDDERRDSGMPPGSVLVVRYNSR